MLGLDSGVPVAKEGNVSVVATPGVVPMEDVTGRLVPAAGETGSRRFRFMDGQA